MGKCRKKTEILIFRVWNGLEDNDTKITPYSKEINYTGNCNRCGKKLSKHGWIDNNGIGEKVCPGDYITTEGNKDYPHNPDWFERNYVIITEKAAEAANS